MKLRIIKERGGKKHTCKFHERCVTRKRAINYLFNADVKYVKIVYSNNF